MENKLVLITGASSGLGKALAQEYHNLGWDVYGISRREMADFVIPIQVDIVDSWAVLKGLSDTLGDKQVDLCILNAGTLGPVDTMKNLALSEIEDSIRINCTSNKPILDHLLMFNNLQSVIAISSGAALKSYEGWGCYCISKAALEMLIKMYQLEHPATKWVSLAPGLIKSHMQDQIKKLDTNKFPGMKKFHDAYESMQTPEEVAVKILQNIHHIEGVGRIDLRDIIAAHENI